MLQFMCSLSRATWLRGTWAHSWLEFEGGQWKEWLPLSAEAVEDCSCRVSCGFLLPFVFHPLVFVSVQHCSWTFLPLCCGSQCLPSVGLYRLCPSPAISQFPFLALPWAVLSPWSSSSFFISCAFLPLPCRKMDISIISAGMYIYICKGIYANLNISVGNTLFIPRLHSKPLAILPRMHPSSAQYHQYSLEIPHRPQTRFSFTCSSWSLVIGLLRWMVLLLLWDQRECCWSSVGVSSLWPLRSLGCLGFRYPSLGQEWGATSQTLFTWHCVLSSFQNRQNTCSGPRAWVWVCTRVQHLRST